MKKGIRTLLCAGLLLALLGLSGMPALAYINRGTVALSLGETGAQVAAGQSVAISATLTPASHDELPGCGMAQCPQDCSPGCMNDTGDCACNGRDYTTYKAGMTLTSANTGVATAVYADGVITVTGRTAGTTTISAVGTLRQYSSSAPQTIRVTVTGGASGTTAGSQGGPTTSTSSGTPAAADPAAVQTVTGQLGTFDILEIASGKTGANELETIKGTDKSATFEKKDADGNVAYSWTFKGTDVSSPADMDFAITLQKAKNESAMKRAGTLAEPYFLSFAHEGALPGKATVNVNTGGYYPAGTSLYLYTYDPQSKKLKLTGGSVKLENGFASFTITHCSDYVLVAKPVVARAAMPLPVLAALCAIAAAAAAAGIVSALLRRKPAAPAPTESKKHQEAQP